jgi:pimeloyl-ACP methyl ester carboxylesterase
MRESADLSLPGLAAMITNFLEALDLTDVTLVANDTGGALVQILMAQRPERVTRVVLTSCDSFERFFPPIFRPLSMLAHVPGSMWPVTQSLRLRALHRLPIVLGWVAKRPIPDEITDSYLGPARTHRGVRRDLRRFLRGVHRRHTLAAAKEFPRFRHPVLLVWAEEDRLFPVSLARRIEEQLPDAELRLVSDCYTFIPEDQPTALSELIIEFVGPDRPS